MISTPNGKDLLYYETCRMAKLKGTDEWNNFELVEMKWYQDPRYNKFLEWYKKDKETGEVTIKKEPTINKLGDIKLMLHSLVQHLMLLNLNILKCRSNLIKESLWEEKKTEICSI